MPKIERAILSCYDKTGIVELAQVLRGNGVEIISTSGTLQVLQQAGIDAVSIADFTGTPEMMDGRVKSLHPKVHAGLLGIRDSKLHVEQMQEHSFQWIDMVVANMHPVLEIIEQSNVMADEIIEQLDIGGMAMIRSAAKNFRYVTPVVNPRHYPAIIHELRALDGEVSFSMRRKLAEEAFACTAEYDLAVAAYLRRTEPPKE